MHANEMSPWDQYEFAQRRNKGVKLNGKVTDNLEIDPLISSLGE